MGPDQPDSTSVFVYTSLPPVDLNSTLVAVPEGWTECFVPMAVKERILSTSGFPAPIDHPAPAHCVRESPIAGQGLFAIRSLKAGELLFVERAMMITPKDFKPLNNVDHLQGQALSEATFASTEADLEILFSRMPPEHQKAFMALTNIHEHDGSGPILGRQRTNRYGLEIGNDTSGKR